MKIEQIEQVEMAQTGNTKYSAKKTSGRKIQETQYKKWCFTFNNYTNRDKVEIEQAFKKNCNSYTFEKEIGSAGNLHFQGFMDLKTKRRLTELKKLFNPAIHWEPCNNTKASIQYCQKDATCIDDIFSIGVYTEKMLFFDLLNDAESRFDDFNWYMNESLELLINSNKSCCECIEDVEALQNEELWVIRRTCLFQAIDNLVNYSLEKDIMGKFYQHLLYKASLEEKLKQSP